MQRAPAIVGWLLFVALCASLAYWLLQWFAPAPRAVAAPPEAARPAPSVAAMTTLFGGRPQQAGAVSLKLSGIVLAGRSSVALIAAEGKPARALAVDAVVLPGMTVRQINPRSVLLLERGVERELMLPPFAAQEGGTASPGVVPEPPSLSQPQPPQPPSPPAPSPAPSSAGGNGVRQDAAGGGSTPATAPARSAPVTAPAYVPPPPGLSR